MEGEPKQQHRILGTRGELEYQFNISCEPSGLGPQKAKCPGRNVRGLHLKTNY